MWEDLFFLEASKILILAVYIIHFNSNVWRRGSFLILSIWSSEFLPYLNVHLTLKVSKMPCQYYPEEELQAISFYLTIFFNSNDL